MAAKNQKPALADEECFSCFFRGMLHEVRMHGKYKITLQVAGQFLALNSHV